MVARKSFSRPCVPSKWVNAERAPAAYFHTLQTGRSACEVADRSRFCLSPADGAKRRKDRHELSPLIRIRPASHDRKSHLVITWTLALLCCTGVGAAPAAQGWRVDETHTWIGFKIDAVGFPTTRGHFTHYSGRILIDFERLAKSFTSFTVDSASVEAGSASYNDFVKSPALLDVARFPTITLSSTQVEKLNPAPCGSRATLRCLVRPSRSRSRST